MKPAHLSILLVLAGCAADGDASYDDFQPRLVDPDAPATDASNVNSTADIPPLGLDFFSAGYYELSGASDLAAAPSFTSTSNEAWKTNAASVPHTVAPGFGEVLDEAADTAVSHVSNANAGALDTLLDALEVAVPPPLSLEFDDGVSSSSWAGFEPLYARWVTQRIGDENVSSIWQAEPVDDYPAPVTFDDSRLRGARLYCSAKRARELQQDNTPTMGRQSAVSFSLFGIPIRLLTVEPRVLLSNPTRVALAGDGVSDVEGAQAFTVPMTLGTSLELASFLPSLPELRTPVSLISADTEVETGAERRAIRIGGTTCSFIGGKFKCVPKTRTGYAKTYQTATHVDAVSVGSYVRETSENGLRIPLGFVGPIELWLQGSAAIRLGQLSWVDWNAVDGSVVGSEVDVPIGSMNDRVLTGSGAPVGSATRSGERNINPGGYSYHDGPWERIIDGPNAWRVGEAPEWLVPISGLNPAVEYVRPLQDDDHAFSVGNEFHIGLSANGKLLDDLDLGPFHISTPQISGGLSATLRQSFEFRDALHAQSWDPNGSPALPATGLSVQPRTAGSAGLTEVVATFTLSVDLFFETLEIPIEIPVLPGLELGNFDSGPWSERSRLRLGTGGVSDYSANGYTTRDKPLVASHLPGRPDHVPFNNQDVESCLADEPLDLPDPPLCDPGPVAEYPVPTAQICIVFDPADPENQYSWPALSGSACDTISSYAMSESQFVRGCLQAMLGFTCEPESQVQTNDGRWVSARVIEWDATFFNELRNDLNTCMLAHQGLDVSRQGLVDSLVHTALCDEEGNLLDEEDIFSSSNGSLPPPIDAPRECN